MSFSFWKMKPRRQTIADSSKCDSCINYETMNCPNSSKCFSLPNKPYFKPKTWIPPPKFDPKPNAPPKPKANVPHKPKPSIHRQDPEKEFLRIFNLLTYMHSPWEVWRDFVTMYACAISNAVDKSHFNEREKLYMSIIKNYKKPDRELFPHLVAETVMALELNPEQDFLGKIFMTLELGSNAKAQIFTLYPVCELMTKIALGDLVSEIKQKGYITINDPCCGAGAMLIAGINESRKQLKTENLNFQNHVLVVGQDIDHTVALMCYIQISLLGMAGYVKVGNTLTDPMVTGDSLENYWFTPVYFTDVWIHRRIFHGKTLL